MSTPEIEELRERIAAMEERMRRRARPVRSVMDGETFSMLRCAAGLSQRQLAARLGVSGAAVHLMDHGSLTIDEARARKIRRIVGRILRKIDVNRRTAEQHEALAICEAK